MYESQCFSNDMIFFTDHIEANVESTATRVVEGNKQLEKAVRHKVSGKAEYTIMS